MAGEKKKKKLPKGITMRADGSYQASYMIDGKRKYLYDTNLAQLSKDLEVVRYNAKYGIVLNPENLTVDEWFTFWCADFKLNKIKDSTLVGYKNQYRLYVKGSIGSLQLNSVKTLHLQKMYNELSDLGYGTTSLKSISRCVSGMFCKALDNDLITRNPCKGVVFPKAASKKEVRFLTKEEYSLFLECAVGSNYYNLYKLALLTGMRLGEVTGLRTRSIYKDYVMVESCLAYIKNVETGKMEYRLQSPKTKTSKRKLPNAPKVQNTIDKQLALMAYNRGVSGARWQTPTILVGDTKRTLKPELIDDFLFTTKTGAPVNPATLRDSLERIIAKMNAKRLSEAESAGVPFVPVKPINMHALRHTFATRAFEAGLPIKKVQMLLGHSSYQITADTYTHASEDSLLDAMGEITDSFDLED